MEEGDRRRRSEVRFTQGIDAWRRKTIDGKEEWGVTIMKKAIILLALTVFFSTFGYAQTLIYSWRDSAGKVHIVDEINKVPDQYREDLKVYRLSSTRGTQKPRFEAPPKIVTKVKEVEEGALREERLEKEMEEIRSSIADMTDRLERLRQERETKRLRMIRKRGRGKAVVREKREIEEIDREIEALTNQLGKRMEGLRSQETEKSLK